MNQVLAFGLWDTTGIKVEDAGLKQYITLTARHVPKTGARYANNRFHKSKIFIVERLINKLMVPGHKSKKHWRSSGHCAGKSQHAYKTVVEAFKLIETKLKKNPVEVFVKALENAAPREGIITIEYGGARYPKAVEVAPQRRIDIVLKLFVQGAFAKSFNTKKHLTNALADEIMGAYTFNSTTMAISKKHEVERQADSSR